MSRIHVLDEHLTNMIAAGEVVERPANIVKECMENSIDAGARRIDVEVWEGGISRIVITDDGCGMDAQDALLAFSRHATSKLHDEDDLFNIQTMGFRGEALPSIASVADVTCQTSDGSQGTLVHYSYGDLVANEPGSFQRGTRLDVNGLFVKTPARFKYLKRAAYEFSIIADIVNKIAICHPDIRITLAHNGRQVFATSGTGSIKEIIYQMYGREVAEAASELDSRNEDFHIAGYAVQPRISRASRHFMYISVNGRIVRSRQIQDALLDAYQNFMPPQRYPIVFLNVEVDTQLVDVNVHPNKWEVRIAKQGQLMELIRKAITDAFDVTLRTVQVQPETISRYPTGKAFEEEGRKISQSYDYSDIALQPPLMEVKEAEKREEAEAETEAEPETESVQPPLPTDPIEYPVPVAPVAGKALFDSLKVIGQLKDSYILCENKDGLVIIDQHAAQERCHYEQLQKKLLAPAAATQPTMIPILLQVPPRMAAQLEQVNEKTAPFGIRFEPFGARQVILRELPLWLKDIDASAFLQDLLDSFDLKKDADMAALRKHMIATMACHSSIRFNRKLSLQEMEQVIRDLQSCDQPYHCPHGRPTVITLSDAQLRKEFERG